MTPATDVYAPAVRRRVMQRVRSTNTTPELVVRRIAYGLGFRYRLNVRKLPGSPDLVFPRLKRAIFVHGCWWHGHACPAGAKRAKANADYWRAKLERNVVRDRGALGALRESGWRVLVVWECETRREAPLRARLRRFLSAPRPGA